MDHDEIRRVALLGLGDAAQELYLPWLTTHPDIQLVAGCDLDTAVCVQVATRFKIPQLYADPTEMLQRERPEVLIIATPPLTHYDLCKLALEHGCHVFCEKPFMPSVEDAERIIALAAEQQRQVVVNHQYYQLPIYQTVKEQVQGGQLGHLYHIEMWQQMYLPPQAERGWKAALTSRRVLYEFGMHAVDLMCYFFDAYPVAVSARTAKVNATSYADACVIMRVDFPEERIANIVFNRMSHAPLKYLEMRLDGELAALRASFGGVARLEVDWNSHLKRPRFQLSLTGGGEVRLEQHGQSRQLRTQSRDARTNATEAHFAQFLRAIQQDTQPHGSASHAREILRTIFAGYQSAAEGGTLVKLGQAKRKKSC